MNEGKLRVLKVPVPNSSHFAIRVKGHVVEILTFKAQVFSDSAIVTPQAKQKMKIAVFVWALIIETDEEETHEFIVVETGAEFPMMDGDIQYISSTMVPVPAGEIELHLFYCGINEELASIDIPMPEADNDGLPK